MPSIWSRRGSSRRVLSAMLVLAASLVLCAHACGQTVGHAYTAIGSGIDEFDVGADASLAYAGVVPGGATTPVYPGTLAMAKTADGENLYQLSGTGSTETIHQYSVDPSTGALPAKSPPSVGSIPLLASEEKRFMVVFNPAATGAAGQNALYVLSGPNTEHAYLYTFDIDPTTGALTAAGEIQIPGMRFGVALASSGDVLVVTGAANVGGEGFQRGAIDPSTGIPEFESLPDEPCPEHSCDDGALSMLDPEHMLSVNLVLNPNSKVSEEYVAGVTAYAVGAGWGPFSSSAAQRPDGDITENGHEYLAIEQQTEFEALSKGETFTGEVLLEAFASEGLADGYTQLPSEKLASPSAIFSLGSGVYVANTAAGDGSFVNGFAYRLSSGTPPVSTELDKPLGDAMTGYLEAGTEETPPPPPKPASYGLAVTVAGSGAGEVTGGGISCPSSCSASYAAGTMVTLAQSADPGSTFAGWTGACSGSGPCVVTMSSAAAVTATFAAIPPPNTKVTSVKSAGTKTTIKFKGTGGYGALSYRCKLGNAKKNTTCHSPLIHSHLAPGKHHFSVFAVDSRGIADPTPASVSFTTK